MKYWLLSILSLAILESWACDSCSSVNTSSDGLDVNNKSFVGISSSYDKQRFWNQENHDISHTYQFNLFGSYSFKEKWQIGGSLPFVSNHYKYERRESTKRFSDLQFFISYKIFQSKISYPVKASHVLYVQQGIKLPTSSLRNRSNNEGTNLSSGSIDFLQTIKYIFEKKEKGLYSELSVKWNTTNPSQYRFGHNVSLTTYFFYKIKNKKTTFIPFAGMWSEIVGKDYSNDFRLSLSGGKSINLLLGGQINVNDRYNFVVRTNLPIAQNYINADGSIERIFTTSITNIIKF